jgi:hypothetical protein
MTADDLVTGIIAVLAERGYTTISMRTVQLDTAMQKAFERLQAEAPGLHLDLRFRVNRGLHGDAPEIRSAIGRAAQRDLVSLDNPEYQDIRFTGHARRTKLDDLPGGAELYRVLANVFVENYEARMAPA